MCVTQVVVARHSRQRVAMLSRPAPLDTADSCAEAMTYMHPKRHSQPHPIFHKHLPFSSLRSLSAFAVPQHTTAPSGDYGQAPQPHVGWDGIAKPFRITVPIPGATPASPSQRLWACIQTLPSQGPAQAPEPIAKQQSARGEGYHGTPAGAIRAGVLSPPISIKVSPPPGTTIMGLPARPAVCVAWNPSKRLRMAPSRYSRLIRRAGSTRCGMPGPRRGATRAGLPRP
jgi:hypothetical protein